MSNETKSTDKLLEFQKRVSAISKDSVNPFFKSKYFDVNTVIDTIKPILNEVGLVVCQPLVNDGARNILATKILDGDKELATSAVILPEIDDVQKFGAAITYFRRYALVSLLLLQGEEDDDGNKATHAAKAPAKAAAPAEGFMDDYLCSTHGATLRLYPAGVKNGKPYNAFMSCSKKDGDKWCKAYFTDVDHNRVTQDPESGRLVLADPVAAAQKAFNQR